jgi:hypothetical protein
VSDFSDPGTGGDRLDFAALSGALLLFDVKAYEEGIPTAYGDKTAVRTDVTVLDGPKSGETFRDALVFPLVMQGQLRGSVGGRVLGRLGQGAAKAGQNRPWTLEPASEPDKALARRSLMEEPF